jgi:choline-sulfatase
MSVELPQSRPNVLIVTVDEWRFPPPYETEEVRQWREANFKGLKALRKHGMEFLHHRASSTACVPSRATIYTGQYGTLTGVSQTDGAAKNAFSPDVEQNKEIMYRPAKRSGQLCLGLVS